MALVLVLGFIALATILVVAFLANISSEGVTEKAAVAEDTASQLATSAVQLVEGTITQATEPASATTIAQANGPVTDTTTAWACQPGMIRTYGNGGSASDSPYAYYKLYSSDNMILSGPVACNIFTDASALPSTFVCNDVPQYWDKAPPLFTDLNAPLQVRTTGAATSVFPILDPRAADLGVEGFSSSATSSNLDGTIVPTGTFARDIGARLPMPVRWLYVLRDGTMTVPDTPAAANLGTDLVTSVHWSNSATNAPTASNPIVGRVAFWTDDESAKLNINTASEGTYTDMPIANAGPTPGASATATTAFSYPQTVPIGDTVLAINQGAQREYQRYPGHPATTCLSSVFGASLPGQGSAGTPALRATVVKTITDAIPRISDYPLSTTTSGMSSMGGTQNPAPAATAPQLVTDLDRLYANLDEFEFNPARSQQYLGTTQGSLSQTIEQNIVDTCRFFLTAHSKAPELNMFGLPRVAMWPVWNDANSNKRTTFDQEILRCSTIASGSSDPHRMVFTRYDPTSPTNDFSIARNQQVYGYLQTLLSRAVPGFGGSFSGKYGDTDLQQILTEIFDYVRCTNLADQSDGTLNHSYTPSILPGSTNTNVAVGQVVPTAGGSPNLGGASQGFGRIATIAELALVLTKVDDRNDISQQEGLIPYKSPGSKTTANVPNLVASLSYSGPTSGTVNPTKQTLLEWALVPKCFSPMAGYAGLGNDFRFRFAVSNLQIGDAPVIDGALGTLADLFDVGRIPNGGPDAVLGGLMGFTFLVNNASGAQPTSLFPTGLCVVSGTNASVSYAVNNSTTGGTIPVSGDVQVTVYSPNTSTTPIQTLNFEFPTTQNGVAVPNVPIPELSYANGFTQPTGTFRQATYTGSYPQSTYLPSKTAAFAYTTTNSLHGGGTNTGVWNSNMSHMLRDTNSPVTLPNKAVGSATVRSLVPTGTVQVPINGDLRYIAAAPVVPTTAWQLAQKNVSTTNLAVAGGTPATSTDYFVSNLRLSGNDPIAGGTEGTMFPVLKPLSYTHSAEIPPGIVAATMAPADGGFPGDWDNGPGCQVDGPYVNKPNEGESLQATGAGGIPYIGPNENTKTYGAASSVFFSPNEQVSSPVMFGSLPVGLDHPWRTLLFRPATLPGYEGTYTHPGGLNTSVAASAVADHLLLDLFWMPVVEPYGISEPLATSGKINLNTQIAPFSYITRTTGLRAVLKSVMITALNPNQGNNSFLSQYKNPHGTGTGNSINASATTRYPIDPDQTLSQITVTPINASPPSDRTNPYPEFGRPAHTAALPNFFVSPSQICDVPLIPQGTTVNGLSTFWQANILTGDNALERPYSLIYPRVTTKSNIFTVHVLAQSLKKLTNDPNQDTWNEGIDLITSEYHGAFTIEKYLDPNTDDITNSSGSIQAASNDGAIDQTAAIRTTKWRLLGQKRFGQ